MAALAQVSETPERVWNLNMATTTALEVASLAASARTAQVWLFLLHRLNTSRNNDVATTAIIWPWDWVSRGV